MNVSRIVSASFTWVFVALAALGAGGDRAPRPDPAVTRTADAFVAAVLRGDAKAVASLYLEDGAELPNCAPRAAGRTGVEAYYRKLFEGPGRIAVFALDHGDIRVAGDVAYGTGASHQTIDRGPGAPPLVQDGKYLVVLRKSGADWKIAYLAYNGDAPAPGAP